MKTLKERLEVLKWPVVRPGTDSAGINIGIDNAIDIFIAFCEEMQGEEMRKEFEKARKKMNTYCAGTWHEDHYADSLTQDCWELWQAAIGCTIERIMGDATIGNNVAQGLPGAASVEASSPATNATKGE